jgi:hypothetical protein
MKKYRYALRFNFENKWKHEDLKDLFKFTLFDFEISIDYKYICITLLNFEFELDVLKIKNHNK